LRVQGEYAGKDSFQRIGVNVERGNPLRILLIEPWGILEKEGFFDADKTKN